MRGKNQLFSRSSYSLQVSPLIRPVGHLLPRSRGRRDISRIVRNNVKNYLLYSAWPRMMPCREFGFESYFGLNFYSSVG